MRKSLLLSALLMMQTGTSISQEFAPIGAKWHYTKLICPQFDNCYEKNFMTVESIGDTVINGKLCSIMLKSDYTTCSDWDEISFVYSENNRVYWYVPLLEEFTLLYDFNLEAGDSWEVISTVENIDTCLILIQVDSVSFVNVNNEILKVMHVKGGWLNYSGTITQRFGHSEYMFPFPFNCLIGGSIVVDCWGDYVTDLRCYQDNDFGFYQRWDSIDCEAVIPVTVVERGFNSNLITVYPIVCSDFLTLEMAEPIPFAYRIITLTGVVIMQEKITAPGQTTILNVSHLERGIYLLATDAGDQKGVVKFIRQ